MAQIRCVDIQGLLMVMVITPPPPMSPGSGLSTGGACTEAVKFLLSSAGRGIWTPGEQSIPDAAQNEA